MPPRLPAATATATAAAATTSAIAARPKRGALGFPGEVVQLGFLLPWADRLSSAQFSSTARRTKSAESDTSPQNPSPSTCSTHQSSSSTSRTHPPPSFIHRNLLSPNPPLPSDLLNHLKARPRLLTRSAGEALAEYTRRVSDLKSGRELERLMMRKRVGPLIPLSPKGKAKAIASAKMDEEGIDAYFIPFSTKTKYRYPLKPNRWALQTFPPIDSLASQRFTAKDLLGHVHWLLLNGNAPDLDDALGLLETTVDWSEGRGEVMRVEEQTERGRWEALEMLHLYLAYAGRLPRKHRSKSSSPTPTSQDHPQNPPTSSQISPPNVPHPSTLIQTFLRHSPHPPNRQTLHLLVLSILFRLSHPPSPAAQTPNTDTPSTSPKQEREQRDPSEIIMFIEDFRTEHHITPGPETWRHIALHAIRAEDQGLAERSWRGWMGAMRRAELELQSHTQSITSKSEEPDILPIEQRTERSEKYGLKESDKEIEVRIRFKNLGTMRKRWWGIMKVMEEKGWVERKSVGGLEGQERGVWGYDHLWVGGEGSVFSDRTIEQQEQEEEVLPSTSYAFDTRPEGESSIRPTWSKTSKTQSQPKHRSQTKRGVSISPFLTPPDFRIPRKTKSPFSLPPPLAPSASHHAGEYEFNAAQEDEGEEELARATG